MCMFIGNPQSKTNYYYYFGGNYNRLHVPAGTKEAYQGAYPWARFKEIIEDADDYPVL